MKNNKSHSSFSYRSAFLCLGAILLSSCGGSGGDQTTTYSVSGTLFGLNGTLVLLNNGIDNLTLNADGDFTFATKLADQSAYSITVSSQPDGQICTVNNGIGTLSGSDITDISVICGVPYNIGGTVSGLSGTGLVLQINGIDDITINADGSFTLSTELADLSSYTISVSNQPSGQFCTVTNATGTVSGGNISDVTVNCQNTYTIGGTVTGLSGTGLVLQNNGVDNLAISANGNFTFASSITDLTSYAVSVLNQPGTPNQNCVVSNGTGTLSGTDVTNVSIACTTMTYSISGTVSGLSGTGLVLQNNGVDNLAISANGNFTFASSITDLTSYAVSVLNQPGTPNQNCVVSNGTGTLFGTDVTNVSIACTTMTYNVGGTVSGLSGTGLVLQNNGGDDLPISTNGSFLFPAGVIDGGNYNVTIIGQPTGQLCNIVSDTESGVISGDNVTSTTIECTNVYTVGGTVSGLSGTGLVLQNNGAGDLVINGNGGFSFTTQYFDLAAYNVTVNNQPSNQSCFILNGSGSIASANVVDIEVNCNITKLSDYANGTHKKIAFYGRIAFIAAETGILIFDISNLANPVQIGFYETEGDVQAIKIVGDYAYASDADGGFTILDITNPSTPVKVGSQPLLNSVTGIDISGQYAYAIDIMWGLKIYNISNPAAITYVGGYKPPGWTGGNWDVVVSGNYVYMSSSPGGLSIIDVSNPASPVSVSDTPTGGTAYISQIIGNYAYVASGAVGLRIMDISDQTSPVEVGFYDTLGTANDVVVDNGFAYVADGNYGLRIIDVSNPSSPAEVGSFDTDGYAYGVTLNNGFAYVADGREGLKIIDVTDKPLPLLISTWNKINVVEGLVHIGSYLYTTDGSSDLTVFDMSNPSLPVVVSSLDHTVSGYDIAISGNYAYIAGYRDGLLVIDITNPANPVRVGSLYYLGVSYQEIEIQGNYAYLTDRTYGLRVVDISNPLSPVEVGSYDPVDYTEYVYDIRVRGDYAYLTTSTTGVRIVDISNPAAPSPISIYSVPGSSITTELDINGNYLYLVIGGAFTVLDISDPVSPVVIGNLPNQTPSSFVISGNYAYLTGSGSYGLSILDITDKAGPVHVASYDVPGSSNKVAINGSTISLSSYDYGLTILQFNP